MPPLQFVPKREFWFVSAFVNSAAVDPHAWARELGELVERRLRDLAPADLPRIAWDPDLVRRTVEMARSARAVASWNPYLDGFPYYEENAGLPFNKLGYFEIEVTYFPDAPERRREIEPLMTQQPPTAVLERFRERSVMKSHGPVRLNLASPVYVLTVTDEALPEAPAWTRAAVDEHKRSLGPWIEVYSGAWPDYTEDLFDARVRHNLSNRLSELHFLRRNSGFVYMAPDNLRRFFDGYMRPFVLAPTAQLRAMHYALMSINESLDILLMREAREDFAEPAHIDAKLRNLRALRGTLHMQMSEIYAEVDRNHRQHYTAVLTHLLGEFALGPGGILARVAEKFDTLNDSMHRLYERKGAEVQERTRSGLATLGTLFSLGVLSDFAALMLGTRTGLVRHDLVAGVVNGVFSAVLLVVLVLALVSRLRLRLADGRGQAVVAADAVVLDGAGRVLLITRKTPPCRGQLALPGTWVPGGAEPEEALQRAVKDETNLDVIVERRFGVYDAPERDPRGRVISHAYLCRLATESYEIRCREDAGEARFIPIAELDGVDLAFDHEDIVADVARSVGAVRIP